VNIAGSDLNEGTSPTVPWQPLARVNQQALHAGERCATAPLKLRRQMDWR
jgi:hypothetical protein